MPFDMNSAPSRKTSNSPYSGSSAAQRPQPDPVREPQTERQSDRPSYAPSGFQNKPTRRDDYRDSGYQGAGYQNDDYRDCQNTSLEPRRSHDDYAISAPTPQPQRRSAPKRPPVRRAPTSSFSIPWNTVLPIIGIICVILFLYLFRSEISAFLSQILSWAITIIIIVLIFRWLFRRRR